MRNRFPRGDATKPGDGSAGDPPLQTAGLLSIAALIVATLAAGCDSAVFAPRESRGEKLRFAENRLQTVSARRLRLMPAVARWKWEHGVPVEDRNREAVVIAAFVNKAEERGLDRDVAERLITDQIEAAKAIQQQCFERWKLTPPPKGRVILDLQRDLRPRIDRLTEELIGAAVHCMPSHSEPRTE